MPLPIRDLYTFFVVARAGAMQAAAHELGVTPGAISQRIRSIEDRYGKRLFVRSRDGVSLTASGKALWKEVKSAFAQIETSHNRHIGKDGKTILRISAAPTFAHSFLVSNLASFNEDHPGIRFNIETEGWRPCDPNRLTSPSAMGWVTMPASDLSGYVLPN